MNRETLEELRGLATQLLETVVALAAEPVEPAPRLLTLEQAADALAVSRSTMQEIVDRGDLAVVSVTGRAVRVDVRDVEVFLKQRRGRRG